MRSTAVIMKEGIECLIKTFGAFETEIFVTNLLKEPFDYTKWQREYFEQYSLEELNQKAVQYNKAHPFRGKAGVKLEGEAMI
ncbi:MAG: hypothetical protein MdMp014T_0865 [Treponematales bacterium]